MKGNNSITDKFTVVIPARYASSRLPGKVLCDINGKTLLERVYDRAKLANPDKIIIATDHTKVFNAASKFADMIVLTPDSLNSGTERIASVVDKLNLEPDEIIVNVQGDEPFINPDFIKQVVKNLINNKAADISTLAHYIESESLSELSTSVLNPNTVKVVRDKNNFALYFSRSPIAYNKDYNYRYLRHIGLYCYRAGFVKKYMSSSQSDLEQAESLEQLRALWHGFKIHVDTVSKENNIFLDVNTQEDLDAIRNII